MIRQSLIAYGEALANGRMELRYDPAEGSFAVWAEKLRLADGNPTNPDRHLSAAIAKMQLIFGKGPRDRHPASVSVQDVRTAYVWQSDR